jgi:hypothetical protein
MTIVVGSVGGVVNKNVTPDPVEVSAYAQRIKDEYAIYGNQIRLDGLNHSFCFALADNLVKDGFKVEIVGAQSILIFK